MSDYATLIRRIQDLTDACYSLEREIYTRFSRELTEQDAPHESDTTDLDDPIPF